jgi:hypothetical protein
MSASLDRTRQPFVLEDATAILARTPATVDTWSPFDVIGHLIHGEQADRVISAAQG